MKTNSPLLVLAINIVMRETNVRAVLEDQDFAKKVKERVKNLHAFFLEIHKDCDVTPFYINDR